MTPDGSGAGGVLERVGRASARDPRPVVVAAILVVLAAGAVAAVTVQVNVGVLLYVDDGSETARNWATIETEYDRGNTVFVVVETENGTVTDPATVRLVDRLDDRYTGIAGMGSVTSLADVVRLGAGGEIPDTRRGIERAIDRVAARDDVTRTLARTVRPESGKTVLLLSYGDVPSTGASGPLDFVTTKDSGVIERRVTAETDAARLPRSVSVTVTGASLFENAALGLMVVDVVKLFAAGFLLVLASVALVMRRRLESAWRGFLSLGTATAALVVMLAVMGVLGYDFNAIMLSVLPVGLGLGVDYGLQIQARYREERDAGRSPVDAAGVATRTTGRTLLLAAATTVVGFGSLLVAPVPPVRQFGVTAGTAVVAAMVLSVTLLVSLLVVLDDADGSRERRGDCDAGATAADGGERGPVGGLERAANAVARAASARPLVVLLVVVPAAAGGAVVYSDIETTQEMLDYWPRDLEERAQFERVTETVASPKTIYVLVDAEDPYAPATFREVASFQRRLSDLPEVNAVGGPVTAVTAATGGEIPDSGDRIRRLVEAGARSPLSDVEPPSRHPDQLLLTLYVDDVRGEGIRSLVDRIRARADGMGPGVSVAVTGKPVINRVIIENVTAGFGRTTLLSFSVAFLVLAVALRSVRDSLLLVLSVPAAAALLMLGAMYLLAIPWNPGTVSMASIALGVGIDYGLHVHERYRELLETPGLDERTAMAAAVRRLSRPVFGSALTTMAGFGVLLVSRFPVVRNFGKTLVLVIALSLLMAFVTLPAVVSLAVSARERGYRDRWRTLLSRRTDEEAGTPSGDGSAATAEADAIPASGEARSQPTAVPDEGTVSGRSRPPRPGTLTECPACEAAVAGSQSYCTECGEHLDPHRSSEYGRGPAEGTTPGSTPATEEASGDCAAPETLVLRARGRTLTVEDGDMLGGAVRRLVVETGGTVDEAVRIHREHVRFDRECDRFYVVDLGDNPTRVNDRHLRKGERAPVDPGDELELSGVVTLRVERPER